MTRKSSSKPVRFFLGPPSYAMRTQSGRRGIAPLSLDSELDGDGVIVTGLPLCTLGKNPGIDRRHRVGHRAGLDVFRHKKLLISGEFEFRSVQPVS